MQRDLDARIEEVRDALSDAGRGLSPNDWRELLEEIAADIDGHLDAIQEEGL